MSARTKLRHRSSRLRWPTCSVQQHVKHTISRTELKPSSSGERGDVSYLFCILLTPGLQLLFDSMRFKPLPVLPAPSRVVLLAERAVCSCSFSITAYGRPPLLQAGRYCMRRQTVRRHILMAMHDRIIVLYKNEVSEQSNNPNTNLLTNNWCSFYTEALHVHYSFA